MIPVQYNWGPTLIALAIISITQLTGKSLMISNVAIGTGGQTVQQVVNSKIMTQTIRAKHPS